MSTRLGATGTDETRTDATVGVGVELAGLSLVRAGISRAQLALPADTTVVEAVETLADRNGEQIRPALLRGDRLRQDTIALRRTREGWKRVPGSERLSHGDRIRFEVSD